MIMYLDLIPADDPEDKRDLTVNPTVLSLNRRQSNQLPLKGFFLCFLVSTGHAAVRRERSLIPDTNLWHGS